MRYLLEVKEGARAPELPAGWVFDAEKPEVVVAVGGDGTMLRAVQKHLGRLEDDEFRGFLGVNTGVLGWLMNDSIPAAGFLDSSGFLDSAEEFRLVEAEIDGEKVFGVNEVRIESVRRSLRLKIKINGEEFEEIWGSGVLVATKLGSTAYNRSLSGAVMLEEGLEMTEISGIRHAGQRSLGAPLVLGSSAEVTILGEFTGVVLGYDNQMRELAGFSEIKVRLSEKKLRIFRAGTEISRLGRLF